MKHKRYELDWHARTISLYVDGNLEHVISFVEALDNQRKLVSMWLQSLHRKQFEMVAPTATGAWVYEGWAL